jgi:hypothetical protein
MALNAIGVPGNCRLQPCLIGSLGSDEASGIIDFIRRTVYVQRRLLIGSFHKNMKVGFTKNSKNDKINFCEN